MDGTTVLSGFSIFMIALAILAIVTVIAGVRTVPQGYAFTVERFGRYSRTLGPGLGLIIPYVERIGHRMNMMEQVLDIPGQEAITRDNASVSIDAAAFFQILDAPRAAYEVFNLPVALLTLTMTNIRTVVGSMDLDELLSHRDEINERLLRVMDEAAAPWGVKVTRIEIKDIQPPPAIADAMTRQMRAEREKRASILEAEGLRQAAILRAEGEKQAQILAAEGRREAAFRDAEARERQAEAEAAATRMISGAIAAGDPAAVNFLVAEKYIEAFRALAQSPNQKIIVTPYDSAGLIGALAGIAEITRPAAGGEGAGERPRRTPPTAPRV
ncbi:SPFH domain-containing protein [Camelimonas abortus]|uniref:SPFH domain-containing protein n=1 Tax=Camelimonas abortus TaxID=1017184 RepID=A0ABV7LFC8_9HYPH